MLKAVFFDIDDTLYSTTEFATRARRAALEAMRRIGLKVPLEDLTRELTEVISEFSSNYEHHFDKLLLRLPKAAYEGINPAVLIAGAIAAYHDAKFTDLKPYPDVLPGLEKLARTGLVRGIITNGLEIKQAEKLVRLRVLEHLTSAAIVISDQHGISKPNVKIYQRACDMVRVMPSEAMSVGDHPLHDIDPANDLGMITVLMARGGKHQNERGRTPPRHRVASFTELLTLLENEYKVGLS